MLQGKVSVITGGARGIGATTAKCFANHGARVVIADIRDDSDIPCAMKPERIAGAYVHCDFSKESDIKDAVDTSVSMHEKLDIMFNNAGIGRNIDLRISTVDAKDLRKVFEANTFGTFYGAKHAARVMVPVKRWSILFTYSVASVTHGLVPHAYSASKHAIVGLTRNFCVELGKHAIKVNCISPYGVVTPILIEVVGPKGGSWRTKAEDLVRTSANLKEALPEEKDIAEAALYLASDESKYVSGLNLLVDGGYSATNVALENNLNMLG